MRLNVMNQFIRPSLPAGIVPWSSDLWTCIFFNDAAAALLYALHPLLKIKSYRRIGSGSGDGIDHARKTSHYRKKPTRMNSMARSMSFHRREVSPCILHILFLCIQLSCSVGPLIYLMVSWGSGDDSIWTSFSRWIHMVVCPLLTCSVTLICLYNL